MPTYICKNTSCKCHTTPGFIRKVTYVFDEELQDLILKNNECPVCKSEIDIVAEKKDFSTIRFSNKNNIKANPPKKGVKYLY